MIHAYHWSSHSIFCNHIQKIFLLYLEKVVPHFVWEFLITAALPNPLRYWEYTRTNYSLPKRENKIVLVDILNWNLTKFRIPEGRSTTNAEQNDVGRTNGNVVQTDGSCSHLMLNKNKNEEAGRCSKHQLAIVWRMVSSMMSSPRFGVKWQKKHVISKLVTFFDKSSPVWYLVLFHMKYE